MAATAVAGAAIPSTSPFSAVLQDRRVLDELAAECVAYTAANGITMFKSNHLIHAPCTLLPMPVSSPTHTLPSATSPVRCRRLTAFLLYAAVCVPRSCRATVTSSW